MDAFHAFASRLSLSTMVQRGADGAPVLDSDTEQMALKFDSVAVFMGESKELGSGTLYITTRRVVWIATSGSTSLALSYPQIVMHAVSRDTASFQHPCLYLQLDEGDEEGPGGLGELGGEGQGQGEEEGQQEEEEEEEPEPAELRFVPEQEASLEPMFQALCECAALNPDSDLEDEGTGDFFFDDAEVMAGLTPEQRAEVLAARAGAMRLGDVDEEEGEEEEDLDELMGDDPSRFHDDAEHAAEEPNGLAPAAHDHDEAPTAPKP